jgi:hypothetical protein
MKMLELRLLISDRLSGEATMLVTVRPDSSPMKIPVVVPRLGAPFAVAFCAGGGFDSCQSNSQTALCLIVSVI